jgi:hypothetical protein
MLIWFKKEKLKDEQTVKKSKKEVINEITKIPKIKITNTVQVEKKYTLWERIKRTLKMS